jgi:hypothetical protein
MSPRARACGLGGVDKNQVDLVNDEPEKTARNFMGFILVASIVVLLR